MNSVMTAGHAPSLARARGGPGGRGARRQGAGRGHRDRRPGRGARAARGPGGEVVGSDFSERMLELAREKAPAIDFEQGNALDLPYDDDASPPPRSGSARATSPTWPRGCARWHA